MNDESSLSPAAGSPEAPALFDVGPGRPSPPADRGPPRLRRAVRDQVEVRPVALDALLPSDHPARVVWEFVCGLDLSPLLDRIQATAHAPGQAPADPRILTALWLYAVLDGVGSARALARLCENHIVYQWICGGVSVNHHGLSDFRVAHPEALDGLLTHSVATLMAEGLVGMERVAQDGMRVRAAAGAASFRRRRRLEECLTEAAGQVEALKREVADDPSSGGRRRAAARERAVREREERVRRALAQMPGVEAKKEPADKNQARVSTTDPDARVCKMGDGGFRPAMNVQFATDTATQVITGVEVTNSAGDQGQLAPMVEQLQERYGRAPAEILVDGGFVKLPDIEAVAAGGCAVYAPVPPPRPSRGDPDARRGSHTPLPRDGPATAAWRVRMGEPEAKEIYRLRASTAECVNAIARNRGLQQFRVRGLDRVRTVVLWYALAHNLMRGAALRTRATEAAAAADRGV
jgi:transposase